MTCPIKLGDAAFSWISFYVLHVNSLLLKAQCSYNLLLLAGTIWKPHHPQNARCILSILKHFIILRMLRHGRSVVIALLEKEKEIIYSNSTVRLKYKLERNDISSEVNNVSPWNNVSNK